VVLNTRLFLLDPVGVLRLQPEVFHPLMVKVSDRGHLKIAAILMKGKVPSRFLDMLALLTALPWSDW